MRRIVRFMASLLVAIAAMIAAESMTSDDADAQRAPPQTVVGLRPDWKLVVLEYRPPPEYEKWWREIAACEHLPLPDAHYGIQYFAVNGREFVPMNDPYTPPWEFPGWSIGYANIAAGQMYLAFPYLAEERIFKHEALHFLMALAGEPPGHPESRFGKPDVGMCGIVPYRETGVDEK